jgi:hypothetical protein
MAQMTASVETTLDLPQRIPGDHLGRPVPKSDYDDSLTIYRGVARVLREWDPLSPGTTMEITEMPVEYHALAKHLQRVHGALATWADAA